MFYNITVVLAHDVDLRVLRKLSQEVHDVFGIFQHSWHSQVTHESTTLGNALLIHLQLFYLLVHCTDGLPRCLRVVGGQKEPPRPLLVAQLKVRHVDAHDPVHQLYAVEAIVRAGIVD